MEVFSLEHSVLKYEPWIQLFLIWAKKKKINIQRQNINKLEFTSGCHNLVGKSV